MSDLYEEQIGNLNDHIEGVESENKKLREALELIAMQAFTATDRNTARRALEETK